MKKIIVLVISVFSLSPLFSNINFAVDYAIFQTPNEGSYVEFYLSINGNSISYAQIENQLFQSNIEITYLIEKGEEIVSYKKFQINSPEYKEEDIKLDLLDLKRLPIKNGEYSYSVIAKDLISGNEAEVSDLLRPVVNTPEQIQFSEIQLATQLTGNVENGPFVKNGFDIVPSVSHAYGKNKKTLVCYVEVYNANKTLNENDAYLIDIQVQDKSTSKVTANLRALKRMKANDVSPIIQSFDLESLPSGEYELVIAAKNRTNELIAETRTVFIRSNPSLKVLTEVGIEGSFVDSIRNIGLLTAYINCLFPISSSEERLWADNRLKHAELEFMQRFFLNFWKERDQLDPERAWLEYKKKVDFVNKEFGYGKVNGYNTERGRVYLQYGAPNVVQKVPYDRDTYPYSVWQYYKLDGMTDRKFIFYSPSMEMLGYEVLHSNVRGERNNPNWEFELISKTAGGFKNTQETPIGTTIQREAKDLFDNPR